MGRGSRAALGLAGAALAGYGLYKAMRVMAAYYHLHPQYRDDISWGPILLRILPFLLAGIVLLRVARRASLAHVGAISGPNGEILAASVDGAAAGMAMQECPFCATELKAQATVCASCGAQKAVGQLGKIGLVGEAAVLPMRTIVAAGVFFSILALMIGEQSSVFAGALGLVVLAWITLYNRHVIFFNGRYRWFR